MRRTSHSLSQDSCRLHHHLMMNLPSPAGMCPHWFTQQEKERRDTDYFEQGWQERWEQDPELASVAGCLNHLTEYSTKSQLDHWSSCRNTSTHQTHQHALPETSYQCHSGFRELINGWLTHLGDPPLWEAQGYNTAAKSSFICITRGSASASFTQGGEFHQVFHTYIHIYRHTCSGVFASSFSRWLEPSGSNLCKVNGLSPQGSTHHRSRSHLLWKQKPG